MLDCKEDVVHVAHPKPVSWQDIFVPVSQMLDLELVPYAEWLSRLHIDEDSVDADDAIAKAEANPALMLKDFFYSLADSSNDVGEDVEAMGLRRLSLEKACKASTSLSRCPPLTAAVATSWMVGWGLLA